MSFTLSQFALNFLIAFNSVIFRDLRVKLLIFFLGFLSEFVFVAALDPFVLASDTLLALTSGLLKGVFVLFLMVLGSGSGIEEVETITFHPVEFTLAALMEVGAVLFALKYRHQTAAQRQKEKEDANEVELTGLSRLSRAWNRVSQHLSSVSRRTLSTARPRLQSRQDLQETHGVFFDPASTNTPMDQQAPQDI